MGTKDLEVVTHAYGGDGWQSLRFSVSGGGPAGMEVVIAVGEDGVRVDVYNPYTRVWDRVAGASKP